MKEQLSCDEISIDTPISQLQMHSEQMCTIRHLLLQQRDIIIEPLDPGNLWAGDTCVSTKKTNEKNL